MDKLKNRPTFLKYYWTNSWMLVAFSVGGMCILFILHGQGMLNPGEFKWPAIALAVLNIIRLVGLIPGWRRL